MRRLRHLLVPVTAVGVGLVISACGGDSSPETLITVPTQTTAGLTKTEFIAQADSACGEANAAIEQFAAAGQGVSEADQIAQLRQGVVDQLNELGPPAEDKATLDQFLTAMRAQFAAGQKIALATERGEDTAEFEAELDAAKSDAETAASAYGFQECGSQISSSGTSTAVAPDTGGAITPAEPTAPAPSPDDSGGTAGGGVGGDTGGGTGDSGGVSPGGGVSP